MGYSYINEINIQISDSYRIIDIYDIISQKYIDCYVIGTKSKLKHHCKVYIFDNISRVQSDFESVNIILKLLKDKSIHELLNILDYVKLDNYLIIVYNYFEERELVKCLSNQKNVLNEDEVLIVISDILQNIINLSNKYTIKIIPPECIKLFNNNYFCQLLDYTYVSYDLNNFHYNKYHSNKLYKKYLNNYSINLIPPEYFLTGKISKKSVSWSIGIMIYFLLYVNIYSFKF